MNRTYCRLDKKKYRPETTPYQRDLKIFHPEVDVIYVLINIKALTINLTCWSVAAQQMQFSQVAPFQNDQRIPSMLYVNVLLVSKENVICSSGNIGSLISSLPE